MFLTSIEDAVVAVRRLGGTLALGTEVVPIADALHRTTASNVHAIGALPAFASSAMDGFAVRSADLRDAAQAARVELEVIGESRAGTPSGDVVRPGAAIRIATGAVVPEGADAVVPYEDTTEVEGFVVLTDSVERGTFIRSAGTDIPAGATIMAAGTRLEPHHLAPLAGAGYGHVPVRRRPRVSVLFTGDEVVRGAGPRAELPPGHIHDVNGVVLPAMVRSWGGEVIEIVPLLDDRQATREAIDEAKGDVIVICGGLSMGPHDHVRPALEQLGARQEFFRVSLQPGKPTWAGVLAGQQGDRLVFGLPGNPASVFVTATLLVRAALDAALLRDALRPLRARLTEATSGVSGRTAARRAVVEVDGSGALSVRILDGQASHMLGSLGTANALALVPPDAELEAEAGVDVVPIDSAETWAWATASGRTARIHDDSEAGERFR